MNRNEIAKELVRIAKDLTTGSADMKKKKYVVDVFRTIAQTVEVEADDRDEAEAVADKMVEQGSLRWSLDNMTDDYEIEVCGEVNEQGEREYY